MLYIGIGAVLALLLTICTIRSKARHKRVARLIRQTPVSSIADLVRAARTQTHAAVQGRVVARESTRLTAPITGTSCVAYKLRVFYDEGDDEPDTNYIEDSKWVPWALDDGTGLALAPFNPLEPPRVLGYRYPYHWPGTEFSGDTFENSGLNQGETVPGGLTLLKLNPLSTLPRQKREKPRPLDRVISHYGRWSLSSRSYADLSWEESVLGEFGNGVFFLDPCTIGEGRAHFQLGSDSVLWFGDRADALSHEQLAAQRDSRWAVIWPSAFAILAVVYLYFA